MSRVLDCEVVQRKTILGVLFDEQLTFEPLLSQALARGWSMFVALFHAAETGGFSVPVLASQVLIRIHPVERSTSLQGCPGSLASSMGFNGNGAKRSWVVVISVNSSITLSQPSVAGRCTWGHVFCLSWL